MEQKATRQGIAYWPVTERPRERLLTQGAEALTDAQLLAILLRVGRQRFPPCRSAWKSWIVSAECQVGPLRHRGTLRGAWSRGGEGGPNQSRD